jgi:flagellar biosynthesis/type III secretory pathway chaperone
VTGAPLSETPDFAALLIEALDEQIEAQTQLAALCDAQTGALVGRDVERLESLTRAIESSILDQRATEERRAFAASGLARELGLGEDEVTLTRLCDAIAGRASRTLQVRAELLDRGIERLQSIGAVNRRLIEGELATIDGVVRTLTREVRKTYSERGDHDEGIHALLDARA